MDPLTHCVTVAQFLPLATLHIFPLATLHATECVLSLFCMSLGTSVTMEGSPSFQIRVSEVQIEWRLVQGHRACQRQNRDWDRRPLTPTAPLSSPHPSPSVSKQPCQPMETPRGSLLISSPCYYRTAAAHSALSFKAPAPLIPTQESPQPLPSICPLQQETE